MSARLDRLEELLTRVRTNASKPRAASPVAVAPSSVTASSSAEAPPTARAVPEALAGAAPAEHLELDEPGIGTLPPVAPASELEAPPASAELEELDDLEGVEEIEEIELEPPAAARTSEEPSADEDEPAPVSHSSPVASSLEDAIETAADAPPLTPPPESGAESIDGPQFPPREGPTMEQLGETIALEEGPSQDFELDEPLTEPEQQEEAPSAENPWEARLPAASGDEELVAPPGAREELERLRLGESSVIEATVARRPTISTNVVELVEAQRKLEPASFLELVDASLRL